MTKLGPREAALRAMREAQFEERQQRRQPAKPVPPAPDKPMANAQHMANRDMANADYVANRKPTPSKPSGTASTYRYRNPDKRRAYMRTLMRRLRAEKKDTAA